MSPHEQHLARDIERGIQADDPAFAHRLKRLSAKLARPPGPNQGRSGRVWAAIARLGTGLVLLASLLGLAATVGAPQPVLVCALCVLTPLAVLLPLVAPRAVTAPVSTLRATASWRAGFAPRQRRI